ncbi:MAG TPA: S41 family peptidase [Saprospiraceae bacterium]|nr:S41 family peptidase [Saprospiraceae bacterium]
MESKPAVRKGVMCIVLIMIALSIVCAQEAKLIPPHKLIREFEHAIEIIEAHPSPYRKISESALQAMIDSTAELLDRPMDIVAFYKLVSPIYATLRDGHTSVRIAHHWLTSYYKRKGIFPFSIFFNHENVLYLIQNFGPDSTITPGAQVLALNGVTVDSFLTYVSRYISYESEAFRNGIITEQFDLYLLLAFGEIDEISITYQTDQTHMHTLQFMSYGGWKKARDDEEVRIDHLIEKGEPYEYTLLTKGIGLLKIHSFAISNRQSFDLFLDKVFRKVNTDDVHSLIIDVRGNTGGATYGVADLVHRLTTKSFKVTALSEMKVSKSFRDYFQDMAPGVNFYRVWPIHAQHSFSIGELFRKDVGEYIVEGDSHKESPKNIYQRFTGDLYLLTDERSFSAATSLAAIFRCYQLGFIVGTPTGGTRVFHANNMYKELFSGELLCSMATTRIYTPCFTDDEDTIVPDITVNPTIFNLLSGRDAALDYTVHLIKKVEKSKED